MKAILSPEIFMHNNFSSRTVFAHTYIRVKYIYKYILRIMTIYFRAEIIQVAIKLKSS